jgi:tetratricopeptide (TPR) repeat protein
MVDASFWGVFWIDASSNEHAKQSFSTIARIGRVEPNERAAKNWLSSLGREMPWLLIIDNADEISFPVEDCYPDGNHGTILITTRNPMLKVHGTVGPRYFHFAELQETESIELLLQAADEPPPWSPSTVKSAMDICGTLGHLPLALLHAGKTILARQCTLENYSTFFEKNWTRIRKMNHSNDTHSISDANAAIYSSYELIHDGLVAKGTRASEDALDLLKVFSFLHRQRIRVDIFLRAASNPKLEMLEQKRREQEEKRMGIGKRPTVPWAHTLRSFGVGILAFFVRLGYRPVLPQLLSDAMKSGHFDELRLREALKELGRMSLVFANSDSTDDSYSMHPVVHLWVRERPEMKIADQAVWCQAAATVLTQAILLPPLGDEEEDEILRRDLLPHIRHVQHNEEVIQARFLENQESRRRIWPVLTPRLDRARALQLVKFSLVYSQCGLWEAAEKLQLQVSEFAIKMLGMEHTATMDILLLLSSTYWQLTRIQEAAELQQRVLEVCIKVRGPTDLKSLKIMDAYGSSLWQQGRIPEARKIHETAVEGFKQVLGENHVDTLRAMGNLGRALGKDFRFTEAVKIHLKVVSGLRQMLGHAHLDTLIAKDNLAMAYFDRAAFGYGHRGDLDRAVEIEEEVFQQRKEKLGREHLYTLWAGLNLARIKALRGEIDEALAIFLPGHTIARRNLGENHFGVLFGKIHYGRILIYAKRYQEAEAILSEVIASHQGQRQGHPDRLIAIASLIKCRNHLGKEAETAVLVDELTESTKALFGDDHAWVKFLLDPRNLSKEPDVDNSSPVDVVNIERGSIGPAEILTPLARIAKYGHI